MVFESCLKKGIDELYLEFRQEIERICVPEILKCVRTTKIVADGKTVGIFCTANDEYIDCLYIVPEYRRKGIGTQTVLDWYEKHMGNNIRLHIIHKNYPAIKFWNSIFELELIEENKVDGLYRVRGLK